MKRITTAMLIGAALLSMNIATANPFPKPSVCPTVDPIQAVGVRIVKKKGKYWLGGSEFNKFDTNDRWSFAVILEDGKDETDARDRTTTGLKSLSFVKGPVDAGENGWVCIYTTAENYMAGAITPAQAFFSMPVVLR